MKETILIVEDEFIVANDLRIMLEKAGYTVCGISPSVNKALEVIATEKPGWVLLDIFLQGDKTGIELAGKLHELDIPFIFISANTNQAILEAAKATLPYGFLVKPFREKDLLVMLDIAHYRHSQGIKYNFQQESGIDQKLELILDKNEHYQEKLKQVCQVLSAVIPFDFIRFSKINPETSPQDIQLYKSDNSYEIPDSEQLMKLMNIAPREYKSRNTGAFDGKDKVIFNGYAFRKFRMDNPCAKVLSDHFQLQSAFLTRLSIPGAGAYQIAFFSRAPDSYNQVYAELIHQQEELLSIIISRLVVNKEQAKPLKADTLKHPLVKMAEPENSFEGIIGNSPLLQAVFRKIELVAPDETSVLILGESGTGKERIAQTIHQLSPRKLKPMVTVNCAALPFSLIESELFGYEKGAFTGANERRIGKFEQADGGSVFLDEIGELPLEAQVKLLRVLQEKEIERIGGTKTRKIDVRIITATNRNLEKEVAEGRFRLDLYYRLNVFPVELPSLRQRKEDIELLTLHFIGKFGQKNNRKVSGIAAKALERMKGYDWPGNIRELEHLIERSILMSTTEEIQDIDIPATTAALPHQSALPEEEQSIMTLEELERAHIIKVLKHCNGKVSGPGGAAELLHIPSTTLNSKIKKLGITFEYTQ
ncbi:sigma 54-interacting transcriptional regulator [Pedobacter sp. AW31-3R]|uniref:sigma 54-interacting transcriptional regulator n=1 Tax=Pedobacter sp. AW31-3R TaxID=3445781 RepID=UPI003F9EFEB5